MLYGPYSMVYNQVSTLTSYIFVIKRIDCASDLIDIRNEIESFQLKRLLKLT